MVICSFCAHTSKEQLKLKFLTYLHTTKKVQDSRKKKKRGSRKQSGKAKKKGEMHQYFVVLLRM